MERSDWLESFSRRGGAVMCEREENFEVKWSGLCFDEDVWYNGDAVDGFDDDELVCEDYNA